MTMLSVTMESRNLIKQVKSVAHIYPGEKHFAFKNKLLMTVDKIILMNTFYYLIVMFGFFFLLNNQIDLTQLAISCVVIVLTTLALQPFFLTLSWINVNGLLVLTIVGYFVVLMVTLTSVRFIIQTDWALLLSVILILMLFGLRALTENYFSKRPLEKLL